MEPLPQTLRGWKWPYPGETASREIAAHPEAA
jgi:hypothetical protein